MEISVRERVIGCFQGVATGDAVGKQTETLSRADVQRWYPKGITGFHGRPGEVIPRYSGTQYEWCIGETTDDTEQTLAVVRALVREGRASHEAIGQELLRCKKSLHPGVSLWSFVQLGDPGRIASEGDGCGAAMRAAPVGVLYPPGRLDDLVWGAYECAIPTHGGSMGISAAAAVAGAVSAALDGLPCAAVLTVATQACGRASPIAAAIREIYSDLAAWEHLAVDQIARRYFPDRPEHVVPLAISLALVTQSAEQTVLLAANIGGDSDSVASIGGAIAGALQPQTVNREWVKVVERVNGDGLVELAISLAGLRGLG